MFRAQIELYAQYGAVTPAGATAPRNDIDALVPSNPI